MTQKISPQLVAVVRVLEQKRGRWCTSAVIAEASGVKPRTVRAHLRRLAERGVVDWVEPFGGNRYRLSEELSSEGEAYLAQVGLAGEALSG